MKFAIFALVGAMCAIVIAGGVSCMVSETDPSPMFLSAGAVVGGAIGSAVPYLTEGIEFHDTAYSPEMKIGMPTF
jgi:hypothetical protein